MSLWTFLYVLVSLPGEKSVLFHSEKFPGWWWVGGIAIIESGPGPDLEIWDGDGIEITCTWPEHDPSMTWKWSGPELDNKEREANFVISFSYISPIIKNLVLITTAITALKKQLKNFWTIVFNFNLYQDLHTNKPQQLSRQRKTFI